LIVGQTIERLRNPQRFSERVFHTVRNPCGSAGLPPVKKNVATPSRWGSQIVSLLLLSSLPPPIGVAEDVFGVPPENSIAEDTAAAATGRVPLREPPVAGRCEQFLVAVEKYPGESCPGPHLALGWLTLALRGLETTDVFRPL
jgi:hypothetical protein